MLLKKRPQMVDKDEKKISTLLTLIFFCLIIVNMSPIMESITGIPYKTVSSFAKMFLAAGCVLYSPVLLRRFQPAMLFLPLFAAMIYLIQLVFFDKLQVFFSETFNSFITLCLPAMMYCFTLRDFEQLQKSFLKMSYLISGMTVLLFAVGYGAVQAYFAADSSYAQGLGYAYLIPILFLIQDYIKNKKIVSLLCAIGLSLFILIYASRGPLLGIGLFSVAYLYRTLFRKRNVLLIIIITSIAALFVIGFDQILLELLKLMQKLGINSRSMSLLTTNLVYDSGRGTIQQPLLREIAANPFLIRGINADYLLVGGYAHNIAIELLYEFGVVVGGGILLYIAWLVGRTAFSNITETARSICFIFMCASITSLLVSGTVWASQTFWIWYVLQRNVFKVSTAPDLHHQPAVR